MHGAPWLPIVHDLPARLPVLAVPVHRDRYLRGPRRRPDRSHIRRGQAERRVDTLQSPGMQRGPAALALGRSSLGPLADEYHGKDEVLAFFGKMQEVYAGTVRLELQDVLANEDHGVVLTRESGE